ncbi:MAG TPA: NADPH:quinone reductase [Candidatus Lokiarchaeia archaeon]|nr:NADPH:quinone reductase [Candidatus Lokiarchaeia archaeon]
MRAVLARKTGGPDVLHVENVDIVEPRKGQVRIKIMAAGVNPLDAYTLSGNYRKIDLPYIPGSDGAGIVDKAGGGITRFAAGDRVFLSRSVTGTFAEFAIADEKDLFPLPESLSYEQGAAIGVPYRTAYHAIFHQARAKAGETMLVHGASGSVGTAAIQLGVSHGIKVIGTAGSENWLELASAEGAAFVFNHNMPNCNDDIISATGDRGVDIILEMLANVNLAGDMKMIARGGRIAVIGSRGEDILVNPRDLMSKRGIIIGVMLNLASADEINEINSALQAGLMNNTLRPVVGKEFALDDAAFSLEEIMKPGAYGKIVILPWPEE